MQRDAGHVTIYVALALAVATAIVSMKASTVGPGEKLRWLMNSDLVREVVSQQQAEVSQSASPVGIVDREMFGSP